MDERERREINSNNMSYEEVTNTCGVNFLLGIISTYAFFSFWYRYRRPFAKSRDKSGHFCEENDLAGLAPNETVSAGDDVRIGVPKLILTFSLLLAGY